MFLKLGFLLVHNLKKFIWTTLLGTLLKKYMAFFKAYIHNNTCKYELLNIFSTISIKVQLCLSNTPFCYGVTNIVYYRRQINILFGYCLDSSLFQWKSSRWLGTVIGWGNIQVFQLGMGVGMSMYISTLSISPYHP